MNFVFKQAVSLDGKDYHRGVHALSGAVLHNATFKQYLELGLIEKIAAKDVPVIESLEERNKRLAEILKKPVEILEEPKKQFKRK